LTPLGFVLGMTSSIGVGTHIAQTIGRSVPNLAMSYQTLSARGKGREVVAGRGRRRPCAPRAAMENAGPSPIGGCASWFH
jgi:hypothetical protein